MMSLDFGKRFCGAIEVCGINSCGSVKLYDFKDLNITSLHYTFPFRHFHIMLCTSQCEFPGTSVGNPGDSERVYLTNTGESDSLILTHSGDI